jgi:hypothetical protein
MSIKKIIVEEQPYTWLPEQYGIEWVPVTLKEQEDFNWIKDEPNQFTVKQLRALGFENFFEVGDIIFLTGELALVEEADSSQILTLYDEMVRVKRVGTEELQVYVSKGIQDNPIWTDNIFENYIGLGSIEEDDDILIRLSGE